LIILFFLGYFLYFSIASPISRGISRLSTSAKETAILSNEVSATDEHIAKGAAHPASSLDETAVALNEMSSMTASNANSTNQARIMMAYAKNIVEKVNTHMDHMSVAIVNNTKSNHETNKIIKTIDKISFQTNLLALNTAGEVGTAFSVVADEVRNLAMRASDAG
jgi:methyl-accepting chemotaxis protein